MNTNEKINYIFKLIKSLIDNINEEEKLIYEESDKVDEITREALISIKKDLNESKYNLLGNLLFIENIRRYIEFSDVVDEEFISYMIDLDTIIDYLKQNINTNEQLYQNISIIIKEHKMEGEQNDF